MKSVCLEENSFVQSNPMVSVRQKVPPPVYQDKKVLLKVKNLQVTFTTPQGTVRAVDTLDVTLGKKDRLAMLGESGCGKTVFLHSLMGLLPENARVHGEIQHMGLKLQHLSDEQWRQLRRRELALVPQDPASALDPLFSIGYQLKETLYLVNSIRGFKAGDKKRLLSERVHQLLSRVGFTDPEAVADAYSYQLSGGMNQRTLIAMSAAGAPSLVLADEPTKGLDPQVREQSLELLESFTRERAMLLITHDLQTARICEKIAIMYAGEIVEQGHLKEVLAKPLHPYTRGLFGALPELGLVPIPGNSPSLVNLPEGCRFHPRCAHALATCATHHPPLVPVKESRLLRCYRAGA